MITVLEVSSYSTARLKKRLHNKLEALKMWIKFNHMIGYMHIVVNGRKNNLIIMTFWKVVHDQKFKTT